MHKTLKAGTGHWQKATRSPGEKQVESDDRSDQLCRNYSCNSNGVCATAICSGAGADLIQPAMTSLPPISECSTQVQADRALRWS
jgi:hypothetical protein